MRHDLLIFSVLFFARGVPIVLISMHPVEIVDTKGFDSKLHIEQE